jgi:hypothetical protein
MYFILIKRLLLKKKVHRSDHKSFLDKSYVSKWYLRINLVRHFCESGHKISRRGLGVFWNRPDYQHFNADILLTRKISFPPDVGNWPQFKILIT